jgi:hypothetical protein
VFNDATSGLMAPTVATNCSLAIDDQGVLHALWARFTSGSFFQWYRNYDPLLGTASSIVDINAIVGASASVQAQTCEIALDANNIVWLGVRGTSAWTSRLLESTAPYAAGLTFTDRGSFSTSASAQNGRMIVDVNGLIHTSFYRNLAPGQYHHRIYDPATGWGTDVSIGNGATAPHDYYASMCADLLGNVHAIIGVDTGTPASTWSFEYRRWDAVNGWSSSTVLTTATIAEYTGIANYRIFNVACDEATGKVFAVYRDLAAGGPLRLAEKGLADPGFTVIADIQPATTGQHEYYVPGIRGALFPGSNQTGTDLDITWQWRPNGSVTPFSLQFIHQSLGTPTVSIALSGPATVGTTTTIDLLSASDPNASYVCALSLGTTPGIVLSDMRVIPVNLDDLLFLSVTPGNGILINALGSLSGAGQASLPLLVPNLPALVGLSVYSAFVVADPLDPTGVGTISPSLTITIN